MIEGIYFTLIFLIYWYYLSYFYKVKKVHTIIPLCIGICLNILFYYFNLEILALLFNLLIFVSYLLFYAKEKIYKIEILLFFAFFLLNGSIYLVLDVLFNSNTSLILAYNFSLLIVFTLIHVYKNKVSLLFYLLFLITIIFISYISQIYLIKHIYINFIVSTLVFLISQNNQKYIRLNYEQRENEYQNKIISQHVEEVENIYEIMRGWRHDYHNHMQTLKAHLSLKRYDLMEGYLNELENDLDSVNIIIQSNNTYLDAILNSKLSLALVKNIEINVKAVVPKKLYVSNIDLCVLIGNLLDNAIESCEEMTNETKFIRVFIGVFKKQLYISVTNSTKELIRKLDSEYITNKRGNHGHGLNRIDNIVKKYDGFINRKNEPGVFVTEVMLPL
ncbi:GHKL domain-containing protein [Mycoplasmatota bacterium]|nr:GHKL domain-containing protein [Mycoplasmatota bacterium]